MYGLPQAGIISNRLLTKRLENHGYRPCELTPSLWKHETNPVTFCLTFDDFGVKCVGNEHVIHLVYVLNSTTKLPLTGKVIYIVG